MPPHGGKGETGRSNLINGLFAGAGRLFGGGHGGACALRCGAVGGAGARVGHGSDRSHPDCGLCSTLEEQVRRPRLNF